jgi:hypothetical protein
MVRKPYRRGPMLKRSLVAIALLSGCSPASLPALSRAPSAEIPSTFDVSPALTTATAPHHVRHVARLAPPFVGSTVTRHVAEGEPATALASTP